MTYGTHTLVVRGLASTRVEVNKIKAYLKLVGHSLRLISLIGVMYGRSYKLSLEVQNVGRMQKSRGEAGMGSCVLDPSTITI